MRKLFVIFALVGTMFLVEFLQHGNLTGVENYTLVAIGFVILAAFTTADLGSSVLSLPRVTGFIVAGVLLGPGVSNILSNGVVQELKMFNTLALGLIALNAGLELSIEGIKQIFKTLSATIVSKLVLLPVMVGGAAWAVGTFKPEWLDPSLSSSAILAIALIFSALAIGTSPAIAIAVSSEMKTKGRLTDLVLGAAIFKDLVVVICLAIMIAISKSLLNPETGFSFSVLGQVGMELGVSIGLGIVFGLAIIVYVRYVRFQMLLFIFCTILTAAEISSALHAELLLVFIAAGFLVRNFSPYEHDVLEPLNLVSLPTFIVFFTIAGAAIDLERTTVLFPVAAVLFVARALAYIIAAWIGGSFGGEESDVKNKAWLGYLPQAGVTLGLVGLAAKALPDIAPIINDLGVTFVALNLLIGPLGLRKALQGEVALSESTSEDPHLESNSISDMAPDVEEPVPDLDFELVSDPAIRRMAIKTHNDIRRVFKEHILTGLETWSNDLTVGLRSGITEGSKSFKRAEQLIDWTKVYLETSLSGKREVINNFNAASRQIYDDVRAIETSKIPAVRLLATDDDSILVSIQKKKLRFTNWLFRKKSVDRQLPYRSLAKYHLESASDEAVLSALRQIIYLETELNKVIITLKEDDTSVLSVVDAIQSLFTQIKEQIDTDHSRTFNRGTSAFLNVLENFGIPGADTGSHRVSDLEKTRQVNAESMTELINWSEQLREVSHDNIRLVALKSQIRLKLDHLVEDSLKSTIDEILERYRELFKDAIGSIEDLSNTIISGNSETTNYQVIREELTKVIDFNEIPKIERLLHKFAIETSSHRLMLQFKKIASSAAGRFKFFDEDHGAERIQVLSDIKFHSVDFGDILEDCLVDSFANELEGLLSTFKDHIGGLSDLPQNLSNILNFSVDESAEDQEEEMRQNLTSSLRISLELIKEHLKEIEHIEREVNEGISTSYKDSLEQIDVSLLSRSLAKVAIDRINRFNDSLEELVTRHRDKPGFYQILKATAFVGQKLEGIKQLDFDATRKKLLNSMRPTSDAKIKDIGDYSALHDISEDFAKATPLFRKGFSMDPLRDKKFFSANRKALESVIEAEVSWKNNERPSSVLVIGQPGSGRTSLINVAQAEFETIAVHRIEHSIGKWRGNILKTIAAELECDASYGSIKSHLLKERCVMVIDDLEFWFSARAKGLRGMRRLLQLISSTSPQVFWLVSVSLPFYNSVGRQLGLGHTFSRTIQLNPLQFNEVKDLVFNRLGYCGVNVEFRQSYRTSWLEWFRLGNEQELFFRVLARVSGGNLRDALILWIKSVTFSGEKLITPSIGPMLASKVDYLKMIPEEFYSLLVLLNRFGPMSEKEICEVLGWERGQAKDAVSYLQSAGQVAVAGRRSKYFEITRRMRATAATAMGSQF